MRVLDKKALRVPASGTDGFQIALKSIGDVMKVMRNILVGLILAALLLVSFPGDVTGLDQTTKRYSIFHSERVTLDLVKINTDYQFVGSVYTCGNVFGTKQFIVWSPSDSTKVKATPIDRALQPVDTCGTERYRFGIHGGILRKQLEKDGLAEFVVVGGIGALVFSLTPSGEAELLDFLKPTLQDSI